MPAPANVFRSDSPAIAKVLQITFSNVVIGDPFTIKCGNKSLTFVAATANAADVAAGLVALILANQTLAEFAEMVPTASGAALILTATTAGVPFDVTVTSATATGGGITVAETTPGKLAVNEVHQVNLVGAYTGGTFTISQPVPGNGTQTTGNIAYNASAAAVQAALAALVGVGAGQVVVTGGPGPSAAWFVQWTGSLAGQSITPGTINGASLTGAGAVTVAETQKGNGLSDDIQILDTTVSIAQPADVSTYTLSLDGQATVALGDPRTAPVSAAALQTALQNLPNVGAGNVLVYAANNQNGVQCGIYAIHFTGALAATHVSTLVVGGWTGREPAPAITKVQNGGQTTSDDFQWIDLGLASTPAGTGGTAATFTTTINGQTTLTVSNTSQSAAADLAARIGALSSIGASNVTVYGPANTTITSATLNGYLVRFTGAKANTTMGNITVAVGTGPGATVTRLSQGHANVNEIQTVTVFGTGGTFTLTLGAQTTAAIAFNALAATVQTRIQTDLANTITACTVTGAGTIASPYVVTVTNPGNKAIAVMTGSGASLTGGGGTDVELTAGAAGVNEVQTVTLAAGITGGTFTLSFNNATTIATAYNASAATVQTNLQALSTVNTVSVAGAAGGPWTVTWSGAQGSAPQSLLGATGSQLIGPAGTVSVTTLTPSSGPLHYDDPLNWTLGNVPNSGDQVFFDAGTGDCLYGLTQISSFTWNTVTNLGSFTGPFPCSLQNGQSVYLTTTNALPAGLAVNTLYYLTNVNRDAQTFQLATTPGGAAINVTTTGSGIHTCGVRLAGMEIDSRYTGSIGLPRANSKGYYEYRALYLHVGLATVAQGGANCSQTITIGTETGSGSGKLQFDTDADLTALKAIVTSGSSEAGVPALLWKGTNTSNTLNNVAADVGVAMFAGETAALASIIQRGGSLELGSGVTLTGPIDKIGGTLVLDGATVNGVLLVR